jgi:hypothetical protein
VGEVGIGVVGLVVGEVVTGVVMVVVMLAVGVAVGEVVTGVVAFVVGIVVVAVVVTVVVTGVVAVGLGEVVAEVAGSGAPGEKDAFRIRLWDAGPWWTRVTLAGGELWTMTRVFPTLQGVFVTDQLSCSIVPSSFFTRMRLWSTGVGSLLI